jgi:hypothetical protein
VKTIFSFFFLPLFFQLFIFSNCQTQDKPPRSELLPKLAEILHVSVAELLDTTSVSTIMSREGGPTGKLRKTFEKACKLPRYQQDKIVEVVEVFLSQFQQQNEQKTF